MILRTPRLILRNWGDADRDLFHRINSQDEIMAYFPMRRDRAESDAMMDRLATAIARDGYGWTAAETIAEGRCIGFVGLSTAHLPGILPDASLEIGWRLVPEHWGHGYATEAARHLLGHAFHVLGQDVVYSFAVVENLRSIAVMKRLGMQTLGEFDHPHIPESHPHLRRHALFMVEADDFDSL